MKGEILNCASRLKKKRNPTAASIKILSTKSREKQCAKVIRSFLIQQTLKCVSHHFFSEKNVVMAISPTNRFFHKTLLRRNVIVKDGV